MARERVSGTPEGEVTPRPQQLIGLAISNGGVDPVPDGRGVDQVKGLPLALPVFEGRYIYLDGQSGKVSACLFSQPAAHLHAHDHTPRSSRGRVEYEGRTAS